MASSIVPAGEEDPFAAVRGQINVKAGEMPAFQATTPGMSVITLEVPSVQSKDAWYNFLNMLTVADGMVILRPSDAADYDGGGYLYNSDFLSEVYEVMDSRPMFMVCVCKGPIRASMMFFPCMSQLVLATKDATFGFPDVALDRVHSCTSLAMRKRCTDAVQKRLFLVGDTVDATDAQRIGLADFVGTEETVENEVCRLIYRNCSPVTSYYMYKPDMATALEAKEELEDK
jgi:enoyl-CoA hydratase/carnithine racemase